MAQPKNKTNTKAVLVALEEHDYRTKFASLLRSHRFMVDTAGSGFETISMIENANYGLVILGDHITDMYGEEVLALLRGQSSYDSLFIIMLIRGVVDERSKELKSKGANLVLKMLKDMHPNIIEIKNLLTSSSFV